MKGWQGCGRPSARHSIALLCSLYLAQLSHSANLNSFIEHETPETKAQEQRRAETEAALEAKRAATERTVARLKAEADAQARLKIPKVSSCPHARLLRTL